MKKIIFGIIGLAIMGVAFLQIITVDLSSPERTCISFANAVIESRYSDIGKIYPYDLSVPRESAFGFGMDVGSSEPIENVTAAMNGADIDTFYVESYSSMFNGNKPEYVIRSDSWDKYLRVSIEMVDGKFYVTEVHINTNWDVYKEDTEYVEDTEDHSERQQIDTTNPDKPELINENQESETLEYDTGEYELEEIKSEIFVNMESYWEGLMKAINTGDFYFVRQEIFFESNLYNAQINLVNDLSERGISEEMVSSEILEYDMDNVKDGIVKIKTKETIRIIHPDKENTKDFYYTYTLKPDSNGLWMPSEIAVE